MSIAVIYCPPIRRYSDPSPKVVQVRPRKRVKLATTYNKARRSFKQRVNVPLKPALRKMRHLCGAYSNLGYLFMRLKRFLRRYLRLGAGITRLNHTPGGYLRLKHAGGQEHYQRLASEEPAKLKRRRTLTLGNRRMRLGRVRMFRLRLRCFSPMPLLKKLRDAYVKMMLRISEKGHLQGLVMSHHWSFPTTTSATQLPH